MQQDDGRPSSAVPDAQRHLADVNVVENKTEDQTRKRGDSVNIIRYGVPTQTTTQK